MPECVLDSRERLAALQRSGLMDSPAEDAFDALVEVARDLLGGTAALVSLVDERRQFFKAQIGLGEPWASARQTPLSHSFCQLVVKEHEPLLVENARLDPRVKGNGAIEDLGVIAYAGVPLVDKDDHTLGALCVVDGQPRRWTEKEVRTLRTLAKAVMAEVHLREAFARQRREALEREQLLRVLAEKETALRQALERTRQVVEAVGAGIWELDVATGQVEADARTKELMGLAQEGLMTLDSGLKLIDSEQSTLVAAATEAALRGEDGGRFHMEFRTGGTQGLPVHWVESRAQAFFDASGRATHLAGVNLDITERKAAESLREELFRRIQDEGERLRLMFEQAPACIALLEGPEHRFRIANAHCRQWVGHRQMLGRSMAEVLPEAAKQGLITLLDTVRRTGEPYVGRGAWFQLRRRPEDPLEDVCLDFIYQPLRNSAGQVEHIFFHAVDVTGLVRSREAAQLAVQELRSLTETLRTNEERLNLALDVVGAGIWEVDLSTQEVLADRRFRDLFGLTWEEPFSLEKGLAIIHPEDSPRVAVAVADAIAGKRGGAYEAEYRTVPRADGNFRWVAARGQAFFTSEGRARRFIGTGVDISERKSTELAQSRLLSSIANQDVFGVAVLEGSALRFTLANAGYRHLVGDRDVMDKSLLAALPELVGQGVDTGMREVLRTGKSFSGRELRYYLKSHGAGEAPEERAFNFVWQPIFGPSGAGDSVLVITQDVTDQVQARKRVEALLGQLAESEERQKRMVAASGAGLWELEGATGHMTSDERMVELMGLPPGTIFTLASGLDEVNPEDREPVAQAIARTLAGENEGRYWMQFRTGGRNGVPERWVESRAQRLVDARGRVFLAGAMLDITARKRAEAEREELVRREAVAHAEAEAARARLAKFVENAPAALGTVRGPHHVFEMVNPRYQELMGTHRQLLGRPMAEAAPEVVAQGFIQLFDTVYRTGEPFCAEGIPAKLNRQGDGTLEDVFFNLTFQPARGIQGEVEGVDVFGFDVTSQVRLRQREEELKRLAEERTALEQQLIGIVSHDLRNPLGVILLGASTLAHNPSLNERAVKGVLRISAAAERASRMVKDLLDFTQARLGKGIPVHPRTVNLAEALEGWVEESRAVAPERSVNLHVEGLGQASADPDRMAQVVGNLVSNALKYSPPDSPVDVRLREEPETLVLEVHNTGTPIPEAQQARVFQPLERGLNHRDMSSRSVGLGLFIVKHVVEAHGGSVSVTSTAEVGTTFSVRLPR